MKKPLLTPAITLFLLVYAALAANPSVCRADDPNGLFYKPIPPKTVVLTFDDAPNNHYTYVAPLLTNYGFGGTFYITEAFMNSDPTNYMSWDQVSNLWAMGKGSGLLEIGNHTVNHAELGASGLGTCRAITAGLQTDFLSHGITNNFTTLAYPIYLGNPSFYKGLYELGYLFARGGDNVAYNPSGSTNYPPFNLPSWTINDAATNANGTNIFYTALTNATAGKVVIFTFHGVPDVDHPSISTSPANFAAMMQYLKVNNFNVIAARDLARYVGRINASFTNTPVTDCTSTSAVLHTTFRCAGLTNYVYAYWNTVNGGTNDALWTNSAYVGTWTNVGNQNFVFAGGTNFMDDGTWTNMAPTNLSVTAAALVPNTTYYYTFCVSNDWGRVWAPNVLSFRLGSPVVDNTGGATNLATGLTQLQGVLSNGVADVYLYWGAADGGTSPASWANLSVLPSVNPGSFAGAATVSNSLYGATYYYRAYASNSFGTAWAPATATFTTFKPVASPPAVPNGSFETPAITPGTRVDRPSGASWTFVSQNETGIDAGDGTWWTPRFVPDGNQAAFMYGYNQVVSISQSLNFARAGNYTVNFNAISREGSPAELDVQVDGTNVLILSKGSLPTYNWGAYTTPPLALSAGAHTVTFINTNLTDGASSIDNVQIGGSGVLVSLTNSAASDITNTSAVLNANLGCTGSVYGVYACWSTVNGGTNAALWANAAYVGSWTNVASTNVSFTATGLSPNTTYYFTFHATNAAEDLWAPNVQSFTPLPSVPPSAPTGLTAIGGNAQVSLNWVAATNAAGYNVLRSLANGGPYSLIGTSAGTNYLDATVVNGNIYYYVVSATNSVGESANSSQASAQPQVPVPPTPVGLTAIGGNAQVSLSWAAAMNATGYNVLRSLVNGGPYTLIGTAAGTVYSDMAVTNGTWYYYVVSATNVAGASANSSQASAQPQVPVSPTVPVGLTALAGNAQVGLSWVAVTNATGYNVKRSQTNGGAYTLIGTSVGTNYLDATVVNGTVYYYVVSATNSVGESANSSQASAQPQVPVPPAPVGLTALGGNAQVSLSWAAAMNATGYNVLRSLVNGGPYTLIGTAAGTTYIDTAVTNGTWYYYVVSATNVAGASANSSQVSARAGASLAAQYASGTFTWDNGGTAAWSSSSGGPYSSAWVPGNDAVLEGAAGTVTVSSPTAHNINFNTTGYTLSGASTLTLNGSAPTFSLGAGFSATIGNNTATVLAGTAGFTQAGAGSLTLNSSAVHTFSNGLTLNGGTLTEDFSNLATPTDLINNINGLTLGGGTLVLKGKGSAVTSQRFASTTLSANRGAVITLTQNSATSLTVALNAITRNAGSTLNFSTVPNTSAVVATTTMGNESSGILGPWATVGTGTSLQYATVNGSSQIVSYSGATAGTTGTLGNMTDGTVNYSFAAAATLGGAITGNTLRYTGAAATLANGGYNITLNGLMNAGSGTLTLSGTGNLVIGANKELVIVGSGQQITLNTPISDNGGGASSLVYYNGTSSKQLYISSINNTYSGGTTVNGGDLHCQPATSGTGTQMLGTGTVTINNATLSVNNGAITHNNTFVFNNATVSSGDNSITLTGPVTLYGNNTFSPAKYNGKNLDLKNTVSGPGGFTCNAGDATTAVTLEGANTYSGNTLINLGIVKLTASASINNTPLISIGAGGTFDVSLKSSPYVLSSNTTLSASGTATPAILKGAASGTVSLGSQPILLTYDGSHPALMVVNNSTLQLNANPFTVNGSVLVAGTYTIVTQTNGSISSSGTYPGVTGTAIPAGKIGFVTVSGGNVNLMIGAPVLTLSGFPSPQTLGVAGSVTVTATDANGNPATAYTGTVHFTSSDTNAVLPADYTFAAADQGTHTFSVTFKTAGTQSITASDTAAGVSSSQTGISVTPLAGDGPPKPVLLPGGMAMSNQVPCFTFTAAAGIKYRLDYKNLLSDSAWSFGAWITNTTSTAQPMTLMDPTAVGQAQRFYRIEAANP